MAFQNIWKQFSFIELSKTMRQKDDKRFAQIMAILHVGEQTDADINPLKNRVLPLSRDHPRYPLSTIHFWPASTLLRNLMSFCWKDSATMK